LREVISPTPFPQLGAVVAGALQPGSTSIPFAEGISALLAEAKKLVDVVVLDSPAAHTPTDTAAFARHADATLIVVRSGQTRAAKLREIKDGLSRLKVFVAGIVLNGVPLEVKLPLPQDGFDARTPPASDRGEQEVTTIAVELRPATVGKPEVTVTRSERSRRPADPESPFSITPAGQTRDYRVDNEPQSADEQQASELPPPGPDIAAAIKAAVARGRNYSELSRRESSSEGGARKAKEESHSLIAQSASGEGNDPSTEDGPAAKDDQDPSDEAKEFWRLGPK